VLILAIASGLRFHVTADAPASQLLSTARGFRIGLVWEDFGMRKHVLVLALGAALMASAAQAGVVAVDPTTGAEKSVNWRWADKPDAGKVALIMTLISRHAAHEGDAGRVECVLSEQRRPEKCRTLSEPPGSRLGEAAARLASYYKAFAHDDTGASTVGRTVRVDFALNSAGGFEY
jgi:hypothetical protein